MQVKDTDILKTILIQEEPEAEVLPRGFEEDPMGFILKKYPGLNSVMEYMMTEDFREYVDGIFVVAPKPTTFKVLLHNGQYFFLQFMGKAYQATVLGKNYYLMSIGEKERCMIAIARLLRYGLPLNTKGPESGEEGTRPEGEMGGEETPPEAEDTAGAEETLEENKLILKKLLESVNEGGKNVMGTFQFNMKFNEIVGSDRSWDFKVNKDSVVITKDRKPVFSTKSTVENDAKTIAIKWLSDHFKKNETSAEDEETSEYHKILAEILKKSIFEKEVKSFSDRDLSKLVKDTIEKILDNEKSKSYGLTPMGKKDRIGNLGKITSDQFIELIKDIFGSNTQVSTYKPNEGPNTGKKGSSKYNMFQFSPSSENPPVNIILAGGKNKGEEFEADLFNSMKESAGKDINEITNPLVKSVFSQINIDSKKLKPEDILSTGKNNTNRSLDWKGPTNVGRKIADIIIKDSIYLSIKDENGGTFYNGGTIPFITEDENGNIKYDENKRSKKPELDRLFSDLGIDPNKIVEGLKKYTKSKTDKADYQPLFKKDTEKDNTRLEDFKKFLASGYGYGYWYVRKKKGDQMFVNELKNEKDAMDMVGNISEVQIKYPGPSTKSTTIKVITSDENMINTDYLIELRNERGGIIPLSVKMKSTD